MRYLLKLKPVSKKAVFGLVLFDLVLTVLIFKVVTSFLPAHDQLAYLSVISGDVKVSNGITEIAAKNGELTARNMRTLVKTGQGIASLKLQDGSLMILDAASTVEFNRQNESDPGKSFPINLVKGRLLVINDKSSQAPTQLLIGGDIAVRISNAVMGLEVNTDGEVSKRVDCLVGLCLVNGSHLLLSGQNTQIRPGGTFPIMEGIPYETWISLGRASNPNPALLEMFANIFPSITPTIFPAITPTIISTATPQESTPTLTITPNPTSTSSPSSTFTMNPTATPTPTLTETFIPPTPIPPTNVPPIPPTSIPTIPPTNIPTIPPTPQPPPPTEPPPVVLQSCSIDPSTVPIGTNITITFIAQFSAPGYGFQAIVDSNYGQSGCSGTDDDGDGMAYCEGSSGVLPASATVNVTFSSSVGDCVASYSSR